MSAVDLLIERHRTELAEFTKKPASFDGIVELSARHYEEMASLARNADIVWSELSALVGCTSPDGSAELGQVKHLQELVAQGNCERELLGLFTEEMGETLQVIGKIMRHGWKPQHEGIQYDNRADLEREMGDVRAAMIRLCAAAIADKQKVHDRADAKLAPGGTIIRWCMPYAKPA